MDSNTKISFDHLWNADPNVQYFPDYDCIGEYAGIQIITYDGADTSHSHTKVFAHIGFPADVSKPVPAVVLVHGGGGHPEDRWMKKWIDRGYAAISMDTTGYFPPKPLPFLNESANHGMEHVFPAPFAQEGYTNAPDNSNMNDCDLPLNDQWMYHAVSQVILANNILRNDPRVNADQIGLVGISWGGIIASIVIGYDSRFAFAVPIYGSGYLSASFNDGVCRSFRNPSVAKWFAEKRFPLVKMPVMWLCWNDDCAFSINSNTMSYLDTKDNNANTCLSALHNMGHSHTQGYTPEESYWFADTVLRGDSVPSVCAEYANGTVTYSCSVKPKQVQLYYIKERMSYVMRDKYSMSGREFMAQDWNVVDLDIESNCATLPENAVGKYVAFTLENGIVLCTAYTE